MPGAACRRMRMTHIHSRGGGAWGRVGCSRYCFGCCCSFWCTCCCCSCYWLRCRRQAGFGVAACIDVLHVVRLGLGIRHMAVGSSWGQLAGLEGVRKDVSSVTHMAPDGWGLVGKK